MIHEFATKLKQKQKFRMGTNSELLIVHICYANHWNMCLNKRNYPI